MEEADIVSWNSENWSTYFEIKCTQFVFLFVFYSFSNQKASLQLGNNHKFPLLLKNAGSWISAKLCLTDGDEAMPPGNMDHESELNFYICFL